MMYGSGAITLAACARLLCPVVIPGLAITEREFPVRTLERLDFHRK